MVLVPVNYNTFPLVTHQWFNFHIFTTHQRHFWPYIMPLLSCNVDCYRRATCCNSQVILLLFCGCLCDVLVLCQNHCCLIYICNPQVFCDVRLIERGFWRYQKGAFDSFLQTFLPVSSHQDGFISPIQIFDRLIRSIDEIDFTETLLFKLSLDCFWFMK